MPHPPARDFCDFIKALAQEGNSIGAPPRAPARDCAAGSPWGLSAAALKWIALAAMTIDHINRCLLVTNARLEGVPALSCIGKLAPTLFLFLVTESLRRTSDRGRYCLRLLAAGFFGGAAIALANVLIFGAADCFLPRNVLLDYFYVACIVLSVDSIRRACRGAHGRTLLYGPLLLALGLLLPLCLPVLADALGAGGDAPGAFLRAVLLIAGRTEYPAGCLLLGVLWYACRSRKAQCRMLTGFFLLSAAVFLLPLEAPFWFTGRLLTAVRWLLWQLSGLLPEPMPGMLLAIPLLLLYNGRRGRQIKLLFYVYYPAHRWALFLLGTLLHG